VHRLAFTFGLLFATRASAEPCSVAGDPELGGTVAQLLARRGVDPVRCSAVHARIERRGETIVVASEGTERVVGDASTAATVVESWVRSDLAAPLLAAHAAAIPDPMPSIDRGTAPLSSSHGIHAMAVVETSFSNDGAKWLGPQLGACIMMGPICAAARVRFAKVVAGPGPWDRDDRTETELLIGGDIPLHVGRVAIVPGFGGGIGMTATHVDAVQMKQYSRTGGLRADAHVMISVPLWSRLALGFTAGVNIPEATHVESNTSVVFPDEPWLIGRVGIGLYYGDP
jgi:hypothetical protein